jgi:hypothetical protein
MPANFRHERNEPFPTRGIPGGWDELGDHAELRARAEAAECRQLRRAAVLGTAWRAQIAVETPARASQRPNRPA